MKFIHCYCHLCDKREEEEMNQVESEAADETIQGVVTDTTQVQEEAEKTKRAVRKPTYFKDFV